MDVRMILPIDFLMRKRLVLDLTIVPRNVEVEVEDRLCWK